MNEQLRQCYEELLVSQNHAAATAGSYQAGYVFGDRYKILQLIGCGGMGAVYRVEQIFLRKQFALKTLNRNSVSENAWQRFLKEAKAASVLDHPGLVKVHDFGMAEQVMPFMVMDYVEGVTLAQLIKSSGSLPADEVIEMFIQACDALAFAHKKGIVHRDLKPSNIMVSYSAAQKLQVKIVDFGIAKMISNAELESMALTRTGEIFGTPQYMSPEQCQGLAIDHRSDIYSLGCAMFEALTGSPPFVGDGVLAIMMKHHNEVAPSLSEGSLGKRFPPALERVISRMLEKKCENRYQDCDDIVTDLRRAQKNETPIVTPAEARAKELKKSHWMQVAALGSVWILSVIGSFLTGQMTKHSEPIHVVPQPTPFPKSREIDKFVPAVGQYYSSYDPAHPQLRVFNFPTLETPLGYVEVLDPRVKLFSIRDKEVKFCPKTIAQGSPAKPQEASGILVMENYHPFAFKAGNSCFENPDYFNGFRSDELQGITLSSMGNDVDGRAIDEHVTAISRFHNLRALDLTGAKITDASVDAINKSFPELADLSLGRTKVPYEQISKLKRLPYLNRLDISSTRPGELGHVLSVVKDSTSLRALIIIGTSALRDTDLETISHIPNLTVLDIDSSDHITDEGLKHLTHCKQLRFLSMTDCRKITAQGLSMLSSIGQLQELTVSSSGSKTVDERLKSTIKSVAFRSKDSERLDLVKDTDVQSACELYSRPEEANIGK